MGVSTRASPDAAEIRFFGELQRLLKRPALNFPPTGSDLARIGGVDAAYRGQAVVAVATSYDTMGSRDEIAIYRGNATFPYVSGLFYLHEGPFAMQAVTSLRRMPDLVCFDAHGLAHPRGSGMATTVGAVLNVPSIGICKTLLAGEELKPYRAGLEKIISGGDAVGFASPAGPGEGSKRLYWSPGFSVGVDQLEDLIGKYGHICLAAVADSHRISRMEMTKSWKS